MLKALATGSTSFFILIGFLALALSLKFIMQVKSRQVRVEISKDGQNPVFVGRKGSTISPSDDWEPIGGVIADNLNFPVILHYARPSGVVDLMDATIVRLHGLNSAEGLQIGSLISQSEGRKKTKKIYQFYRIRAVEDPTTGDIHVADIDKARWIALAAGLIQKARAN
ncbi:hypothetical protein RQ831_06825 [Roseomonas gilardii]|uniref:Uncharacterized protein n=1 Tax=Roseomonas gilardii TaxID=257708 RepID=A0ABU3MEF8_9PROT|nr:hypothetical protein [Roseomonas gilardii]MDT8330760.1 hypothetical protein [Roseomonas gilardii]